MDALPDHEIRRLLGASRFGHLGLADEGRAYVVPLFYGYKDGTFYFHSQPGLKDVFIAHTREACLVVDQVRSEDDWASVMVFGQIEDVRDAPDQLRAMEALMAIPLPPEYGFTRHGEPQRADKPQRIYKLVPKKMTGRRSTPAPVSREERELALGGM
jgi:nitroimidazol reductase NimA-like FMN-containing flavoprotein (pyridoxamine 5'-phosphate oxidase superfamily)